MHAAKLAVEIGRIFGPFGQTNCHQTHHKRSNEPCRATMPQIVEIAQRREKGSDSPAKSSGRLGKIEMSLARCHAGEQSKIHARWDWRRICCVIKLFCERVLAKCIAANYILLNYICPNVFCRMILPTWKTRKRSLHGRQAGRTRARD